MCGKFLTEDRDLGQTAQFNWNNLDLAILRTPLTMEMAKKIVKMVCEDYDIPVIQNVIKIDKTDDKYAGWCRKNNDGSFQIELYKDTFNVNFLIHELTHYTGAMIGAESFEDQSIRQIMYHGKKFWQRFAYILNVVKQNYHSS